jgi:hypothetical protein
MATPSVIAAQVIHTAVVCVAKANAFVPAAPTTVPRIAGS